MGGNLVLISLILNLTKLIIILSKILVFDFDFNLIKLFNKSITLSLFKPNHSPRQPVF